MKLTPKEKPTLGVHSLIKWYSYEVVTLAFGSQHRRWLISFSANGLCSVILSDSKQSLDSEEKTRASGETYKWWIKMADVLESEQILENMWDVGRNHDCTLIWAQFGRTSYKKELQGLTWMNIILHQWNKTCLRNKLLWLQKAGSLFSCQEWRVMSGQETSGRKAAVREAIG